MRILHIGDFHYKAKHANYEQNLVIEKMIEALKLQPPIDFIFFSGDLVNSGEKPSDFVAAYDLLLKRLSIELNVSNNNIILCAGNHDINREEISNGIISYFDNQVNDNVKLDSEILKNTNDFITSLKPTQNFHTFIRELDNFKSDIVNELYSIHIRKHHSKKLGILTLNSAWLSSGIRKDINYLMLPLTIVREGVEKLKANKTDFNILIVHHPFNWFREFNGVEIEDIINKEFMMMFSGHIHKEQIQTKFAGSNGIYMNTTQASLTLEKDAEIGYSIIECFKESEDEESDVQSIRLHRGNYSRKEVKFLEVESVDVLIPTGQEKANQNKLRRKITAKYRWELNLSNQLLLDYDSETNLDFLGSFTTPVLTTKTPTESSASENKGLFNFEELFSFEKNYLIFGKDKCGKTSLLKKIKLYYLKNYSTLGIVPLYLDYKEENFTPKSDLTDILSSYYGINNNDSKGIIEKGHFLLLVDNLDTNAKINELIIDFLDNNPNVKFIFCSDYLTSRIYFEELDDLIYDKLYFNDLTRAEIRLYTDKHKNIKSYKKEDVLERITAVCKQLQMPVNYWTISLILLIYKKSDEDYNKNLFGILDMCVDEILQKKQLLGSKNKLNFEQYKDICSQIAHFLLINYRDDVYSSPYVDLITFINNIVENSPRLVADAKDICDYLLTTGILKEKNNRYTFRLNGIFEYFLSYYINHHQDFKEELFKDDSIYLSFRNELEIYSGFKRNDVEFVKNVFQKTKVAFDGILSSYLTDSNLDDTLNSKFTAAREFADQIKSLKISKPLSNEIKDAIHDTNDPLITKSEVHVKEIIQNDIDNPEILERYLNILAKVFKNSDNLSDTDLVYEIFDYLIDAYCVFGFFMIDSYSEQMKRNNLSENAQDDVIGKELLQLVTKFIPLLSQVMLSDGLGHISMTKIIKNRIQLYKKDAKANQFKLYILYFSLIDIDVKHNKELVDEVFDFIKLSPLKVSTFFKLNFYLAFKAYKNKDLEEFFKRKIKEAQLRMDDKIDSNKMNSYLSKKQKGNLVRRGRER